MPETLGQLAYRMRERKQTWTQVGIELYGEAKELQERMHRAHNAKMCAKEYALRHGKKWPLERI